LRALHVRLQLLRLFHHVADVAFHGRSSEIIRSDGRSLV
jgi:hypothetical protein